MHSSGKKIIFALLLALLWLPFFQQTSHWLYEPKLNGAFINPPKPEFSLDSLNEFRYQKKFEDYQNAFFGFRGFFIKLKNSLNYILFRELSVEDNIAGKDNFIFSVAHIERALGIRYNGKENNQLTIERIKFLKDGLEKKGKHLFVMVVPSKETVIPEYMPGKYMGRQRQETDYADFINGYKAAGIPFLDYCEYFKKIKDSTQYSLFTKTGVHWSVYGACIAQDTLVDYVQKLVEKDIAHYKRTSLELSDTARDADADFEGPLNLFFSLGQSQYQYPVLQMVSETTNRYKPKVVIIGDSFFWQIKMRRMLMNIFTPDSKFLYYFNTSCPIGDEAGCPVKDIDAMKELETADVVILEGSIGTLDRFPYGVTDFYYDHVAGQEILKSVEEFVRADKDLVSRLEKQNTISQYTAADEARRLCRDRRRIFMQAANGKYVTAGGDGDELLFANRDRPDSWETFFMLQLQDNKVAIYSYKDKFLTPEVYKGSEISNTRTGIGGWELFTVEKLDNEFCALRCFNGKYVSLDEKTMQLRATSVAIGKNEKFKLID
jgi:hypothetical protein